MFKENWEEKNKKVLNPWKKLEVGETTIDPKKLAEEKERVDETEEVLVEDREKNHSTGVWKKLFRDLDDQKN